MLEINLAQALNDIGQMIARSRNPQPVLGRIGASEVENVRERIQSEKDSPWGNPWEPWAPSTAQHRCHKGNDALGLLFDDGDLFRSIRAETHVYGPGHGTLDIGSDLDYALYLQDGTEYMPARPFLGWNDHTFPFYELMLADWVEFGTSKEPV